MSSRKRRREQSQDEIDEEVAKYLEKDINKGVFDYEKFVKKYPNELDRIEICEQCYNINNDNLPQREPIKSCCDDCKNIIDNCSKFIVAMIIKGKKKGISLVKINLKKIMDIATKEREENEKREFLAAKATVNLVFDEVKKDVFSGVMAKEATAKTSGDAIVQDRLLKLGYKETYEGNTAEYLASNLSKVLNKVPDIFKSKEAILIQRLGNFVDNEVKQIVSKKITRKEINELVKVTPPKKKTIKDYKAIDPWKNLRQPNGIDKCKDNFQGCSANNPKCPTHKAWAKKAEQWLTQQNSLLNS